MQRIICLKRNVSDIQLNTILFCIDFGQDTTELRVFFKDNKIHGESDK